VVTSTRPSTHYSVSNKICGQEAAKCSKSGDPLLNSTVADQFYKNHAFSRAIGIYDIRLVYWSYMYAYTDIQYIFVYIYDMLAYLS
jgi:hypothetical protein